MRLSCKLTEQITAYANDIVAQSQLLGRALLSSVLKKSFLKAKSKETALWASQVVNKQERKKQTRPGHYTPGLSLALFFFFFF